MQHLIAVIPDGAAIVSDDGNILYANHLFIEMFGYPPEELLNQPVDMLVPDEFLESHKKHRTEYTKNPEQRGFCRKIPIWGKKKDKSTFRADIFLGPLANGTILTIIRNISYLDTIYYSVNEHIKKDLKVQKQLEDSMAKLSLLEQNNRHDV